jgi:cytochrome b561
MEAIDYPDGQNQNDSGLRYSNVAIALHWLIATLIFYNLVSGLMRPLLPHGFFVLHVSSGITILVLSIVRVWWRLTHRPPAFLPIAPFHRKLAHSVHFLLYASMLLIPFSGWALVSAKPPAGSLGEAWATAHSVQELPMQTLKADTTFPENSARAGQGAGLPQRARGPTMVWGFIRLPLIKPVNEIGRDPGGVPEQRAIHNRVKTFHLLGAWLMLLLLILHVLGAIKHQAFDKQRELARMGLG